MYINANLTPLPSEFFKSAHFVKYEHVSTFKINALILIFNITERYICVRIITSNKIKTHSPFYGRIIADSAWNTINSQSHAFLRNLLMTSHENLASLRKFLFVTHIYICSIYFMHRVVMWRCLYYFDFELLS